MKVVVLSLIAGSVAGFSSPSRVTRSGTSLSMSAALIVQNKGGGHGELGFQLAKNLSANDKITSITILQDDACKDSAEPFCSYPTDIPNVKIVKAPLADEGMTAATVKSLLDNQSFDYVWDNASKGASGAGKAIVDCAKEWDVNLLTYVSSAGCYLPDGTFPMPETTPVKESAGQVAYENYASAEGLKFCSFRPQYIYGPKSNKDDYVDWYFDRIVRGLPVPIPGDGTQKVSLTNSEDVASLLASVLNDEAAAVDQKIFNCGTDKLVTYAEVAQMCADAAGVSGVHLYYYDGDEMGKAKFPFRLTDFYVSPDTAKAKLGWGGATHSLKGDLSWYFDSYKSRGGETRQLDLAKDWAIVGGTKPDLASAYGKWDPAAVA